MGLSSKLASSDDVVLDWSQELLENGGMELPNPTSQARNDHQRQQQRQHCPPLKCPRCDSTNTKFCYYNNYSRSQPRHFCKACRRHWTEGGTLRNVPVGGCRKNKRAKTAPAATATASGAAVKTNNISSAPLPPPLQQQHKFPWLISGDHSSNIFPEILRQVMLRSQPLPQLQLAPSDYSFASSFSSEPSLPPPSFRPASMNSSDGNKNSPAFPLISSSYSYTLPTVTEECLGAAMNPCSTAAGAWQVGQVTALPTSTTSGMDHSSADYWSGWDGDMAGCS
ncbi:hypothetical protein Cni_G14770 [Canna indica]|uniref:Dof zinc finger protein n=1 Tax=Canna indica TaxID=4628 RepID=A0AAQ3KFQ3_9LILI|nr:hypothetical protein Cni_G14770 [Canna indica]